jgi:hypothetical protein
LLKVERDVAQLLLDVAHELAHRDSSKGIATFRKVLAQEVRDVPPGEVQALDRVGEGKALVNRDHLRDAVARVEDNARHAARGVQREYGLDGDVEGGRAERLKHDLRHLFAVCLGVQRRLGEQDWVLLGCDVQLVIEGVMPYLLHIVPVGDDAALDRALEREDATFCLSLVADARLTGQPEGGREAEGGSPDVRVLLAHTDHYTLVTGTAHDGTKQLVRNGEKTVEMYIDGNTARGASSPATKPTRQRE